jgi:hypothetical protein
MSIPWARWIILVGILGAITACSRGAGRSSGANAASGTESPAASSAPGRSTDPGVLKTNFSFVFGGKPASGSDTDMLQVVNVARHRGDGLITFELNDITHYPAAWPHLHFTVADHGTTTIRGASDPKYSFEVTGGGEEDHYRNDEMTVSIASNGATRVTGTFSGRVTHVSDDGHATAAITDGKFDLPYASRPGK